jgi:hypothetical protein
MTAHLSCFNVSALERALAIRLDVPIYGCDPELLPLASKSGGRRLLRTAGVAVPDGAEDLSDAQQLADALAELKHRHPTMQRAVVKLNEGFSGEGNATFAFDGAPRIAVFRRGSVAGSPGWPSRRRAWDGRPTRRRSSKWAP